MRPVRILATGGTIAMAPTPHGFAPRPGYLKELLAQDPRFQHPELPPFTLHEYSPLMDSATMRPEHWHTLARDIAAAHEDGAGVVVLHGTDTMAYTASALAFLLENLHHPVVLTGSQLPMGELRSDAPDNLLAALLLAAQPHLPEVALVFGHRILRGCRATKVDASGFMAFDSPNYPDLGALGVRLTLFAHRLRPKPQAPLCVHTLDPRVQVGVVRLFPGISAAFLANVLRSPLQGLILETYGMGNGPSSDTALLGTLERASRRGVVVVNCTQCLRGGVDQEGYATGSALARAGVVSGGDMTVEAALTKLLFLLSTEPSADAVRARMEEDLRGERTPLAPSRS
ncbi:MAG: ansA [Desulfomicrobiaceae bacterium]|jgi:L-asparaginase|nr:ansA [Desulfomicrobiaceae bacterium]